MTKTSDKLARQVVELTKQGKTRTFIRESTGLSLPTIRKIIKQAGGKVESGKHAPTRYTDDQKEEIRHRYESGEIPSHIADDMGLNRSGVIKLLRRHYKEARKLWRQHKHVGPLEFVEAWQNSSSAKEVAKKLGIPLSSVYGRAHSYRQRGVKLKTLAGRGYNWSAIAEFANLFNEEEEE